MRLEWRPPTEAPYLSYGERTVVATRHHPIVAILPFLQLAVFVPVALLAMAFIPVVGAIAVLALALQWLRYKGFIPMLSFLWTAVTFGALLLVLNLLDDPESVVYLGILAAIVIAAFQLIEYLFFIKLYLTDRRIFRVSGILTRRVATMPLRALTDIRYDQTLFGRLIHYGHFFVESAGQNQALSEVRYVPEPERFYRIIMSEALAPDLPPEFITEL